MALSKNPENFNLIGNTRRNRDNTWGCEVVLETPDGSLTLIESPIRYSTDSQALLAVQAKMTEIIKSWGQTVEVVSEKTLVFPDGPEDS